jgi:hypothetical protein
VADGGLPLEQVLDGQVGHRARPVHLSRGDLHQKSATCDPGRGQALQVVWVVALTVFLVLGVVGAVIGDMNGMLGTGFWLGFLLGPVGLVIVACLPPVTNTSRGAPSHLAPGQESDVLRHGVDDP